MSKVKDITGRKFGRLFVIERCGSNKEGKALWRCRCDCGNEKIVVGKYLRSGDTVSCGCYNTESISIVGKNNATHGSTKTRLYQVWRGMKARCENKNHNAYKAYGGRGIEICQQWESNFEQFRDWALLNGYKSDLSIDRIDVNGNYEPSNCKWSTAKEQAVNRRTTKMITHEGKTLCMTDWARKKGIRVDTLWRRLTLLGFSTERALSAKNCYQEGTYKKTHDRKCV